MIAPFRTEEIDQAVARMPPVSTVLQRLLVVLDDPHSDLDDVARLLGSETVLAARILRVANSAFYAFPEPVGSIAEAVQRLGVVEVHAMVSAMANQRLFLEPLAAYAIAPEELWNHALATSVAAETIALATGLDRGASRLAGILHPVGLLALDRLASMRGVPPLSADEPMLEWELKHFGVTNDWLAAEVLWRWRLPEQLVAAVSCRYVPGQALPAAEAANLLHLASCLAVDLGAGLGPERGLFTPTSEVVARAGVEPAAYGELAIEAGARLERARELLALA